MTMHRRSWTFVLGVLTLAGCAAPVSDDSVEADQAGLRAPRPVPFSEFSDPQGVGSGAGEVRRLINSARQYERILGHAPPAGVSFRGNQIVVLYDAGVKPTGGYVASIQSIEVAHGTLYVTTRLESPGPNCLVTESLTHPYALATLKRPRGFSRVSFATDDTVRDCDVPRTCEDIECPDGQHCEVAPVWCIRAPCPELAQCVPDQPPPVLCGGIAGIPCPGSGQCEDNPDDECDPDNGGADCGGICRCVENQLCVRGHIFDSAPDVCACVPDPNVPFCGGIAGFPCPGAGMCVDNPDDECDPENGGADCGGYCECNALGLCASGSVWDSSPSVCGCVPEMNPCAATLCPTGTTCEVIDGAGVCISDGTEACGSNTCSEGYVCCNASCGVCTKPGMFCTQQACNPTP